MFSAAKPGSNTPLLAAFGKAEIATKRPRQLAAGRFIDEIENDYTQRGKPQPKVGDGDLSFLQNGFAPALFRMNGRFGLTAKERKEAQRRASWT